MTAPFRSDRSSEWRPLRPSSARATTRYLAGVCSAIARRFGIDVTIVRVLWVLAVLVFGFGFLLYLIFWIVIPSE